MIKIKLSYLQIIQSIYKLSNPNKKNILECKVILPECQKSSPFYDPISSAAGRGV